MDTFSLTAIWTMYLISLLNRVISVIEGIAPQTNQILFKNRLLHKVRF